MDIEKSLEILKHREDYVFSNSDMDEAIKEQYRLWNI